MSQVYDDSDDDVNCYHDHDEYCGGYQGFLSCSHTHCMSCGGCYCDDYQTYNLRPSETGGPADRM